MRLATLKKIPLFYGLSDSDFDRLCEMSAEIKLAAGEILFEEGSAGNKAFVIETGQLEVLKGSLGRDVLLSVRGPGEIIGEVALLDEAPRMASVKARTDSVLLAIQKESLDELLRTSPTALNAMFRSVLMRLRETQSVLQQSEKMAQLGTLTAGVAHELNNPAAAIQRGEQQLHAAFRNLLAAQAAFEQLSLPSDLKTYVEELVVNAKQRATAPPELDALARSDKTDEIESWLAAHQLTSFAQFVGQLVDLNYTTENLDELAKKFNLKQLTALLPWLALTYAAYGLLAEIGQGATRISAIVKALKSYSYLDQAPIQAVDLKAGVEDTLLILGSKLRGGISLQREYAKDLPLIQGYGSELNQVWTNILDNAIDAMDGRGEIKVRTRREGDWAIVEIEDNGPGIPTENQTKVFDAFFTTKPPGRGTGLGLNISYNIVVHKHRGDIRLSSEPGKTRFEIRLPIDGN
jgi:signal transduction histidine kinase